MANLLRIFRERHSISQAELARRVGVSRQMMSAMEVGNQEPSLALALRLAQELDQPVEKLFRGDADMKATEKNSLTKVERLMLSNQYRLLEKLHVDDEYDKNHYARLAEIFEAGYTSLYRHAFSRIQDQLPEEVSEEVLSILDMHRAMRFSLGEKPDPAYLEKVKFLGFDANNEGEHLSFAQFFSEGGKKYPELQIYNSHHSTLPRYRKMLTEWSRMGREPHLTRPQIDSIIEAGTFNH